MTLFKFFIELWRIPSNDTTKEQIIVFTVAMLIFASIMFCLAAFRPTSLI